MSDVRLPDRCDSRGPVWERICTALGIEYPPTAVWPDNKTASDWSMYRFSQLDLALVVAWAVVLTLLRYRVQRWAKQYATSFTRDAAVQLKFSESLWKTLFYVTSFSWGAVLCHRRDWRWSYDYDAVFLHVPEFYRTGFVETDVWLFYIFQIGFYCHSIFAHVFVEVRRKDFVEMLAHHVATLTLVFFSYATRFTAIGTLIVTMHDISDVLLEVAKQFVYREKEVWANIWFGLWVLSWIVLRLIYYPSYILYGAIWVSPSILGHYPVYDACMISLITLQILHIVWSFMIAKMIIKLMSGDKVRDTREDDESTKGKKAKSKKNK